MTESPRHDLLCVTAINMLGMKESMHIHRTLFILLALLATVRLAIARLGESLPEARNRYGEEISSEGYRGPNSPYTATFLKESLRIRITFAEYGPGETKAIEIVYTRTDTNKWSNNEVNYLFKVNSQGYEWSEQVDKLGHFTVKRSDGGTAIFNHREQSLKLISAESYKRKPEVPKHLEGF